MKVGDIVQIMPEILATGIHTNKAWRDKVTELIGMDLHIVSINRYPDIEVSDGITAFYIPITGLKQNGQ